VTENVVTDNGFVHNTTNNNTDKLTQNGSAIPQSNGKSSRANGEIQSNDPVRKGAFKKKSKGLNEKSKYSRRKSQSVENLASPEKNRVTFEEIQNLSVPRASTLNRSPKDTKKQVTFPFALRKKKTSGSCSDLDKTVPEIKVQSPSPTKTTPGGRTTSHGRGKGPGDKSLTSSPEKSHEKKKLAPFKMFKRRKSQDTSS
jgi:hypothetical protein